MSEIESIVESWIRSNFDHLESDWEEAGGEPGGFHDMMDEIAHDVSGDVECDLESMVEDNLSMHRHYEIEGRIDEKIAEIEPEEVEV